MTLAANWIVVIFSLLFVSLGLSAYMYYLRYRFKYDPMSLRRAFKSDATSPYRFGESSNPQISVLAHWAKIVLVGYALSAVATLGFLMIILTETISTGTIDNSLLAIGVFSFTIVLGIVSYVINQKKLMLQMKEYQLLKKTEEISKTIREFFEGQTPSIGLRILNLGIINLVFFESDFKPCFRMLLNDPLEYNLTDQFLKVYQLVIIEPQAVAMLSISQSQSLTVSC